MKLFIQADRKQSAIHRGLKAERPWWRRPTGNLDTSIDSSLTQADRSLSASIDTDMDTAPLLNLLDTGSHNLCILHTILFT